MAGGGARLTVRVLRPAAHGVIAAADWILGAFAKLLWYYPIMIGCLAIFIPSRFGLYGLAVYGRTSLNLAIVALVWSAAMLLLVRAVTRRTWPQIWKYFATVYVTGFGTGGSYDTLPANLISAERDLGLRPQVARASIVLGTVLNKNVATMAVLLVTVSTCALLDLRITMTEIAVLIPPVMILGLESPGAGCRRRPLRAKRSLAASCCWPGCGCRSAPAMPDVPDRRRSSSVEMSSVEI